MSTICSKHTISDILVGVEMYNFTGQSGFDGTHDTLANRARWWLLAVAGILQWPYYGVLTYGMVSLKFLHGFCFRQNRHKFGFGNLEKLCRKSGVVHAVLCIYARSFKMEGFCTAHSLKWDLGTTYMYVPLLLLARCSKDRTMSRGWQERQDVRGNFPLSNT